MANFETFKIKAHKESWADRVFCGEITVTGTFTQEEWDRLTQLFAQLSQQKKLPAYETPKLTGSVAEAVLEDAKRSGQVIPHEGS